MNESCRYPRSFGAVQVVAEAFVESMRRLWVPSVGDVLALTNSLFNAWLQYHVPQTHRARIY